MVPKFKDSLLFRRHLLEAANKRVLDSPFVSYTQVELQQLGVQVLRNLNALRAPLLKETFPINSAAERNFLKDFKYFTYLMNSKLISLEKLIEADRVESAFNIKKIQKEVVALDTEIEEKEIELLGNYSEVHLNTFSRTKDSQLQYSDMSWLVDFKTDVTYQEKYLMDILGAGSLTNPVRAYSKAPIKEAHIIDELSDSGDSEAPLHFSKPSNLFRDEKIFRYVVVRKEFDNSSRLFKSKTSFEQYPYSCISTLTVQLDLANLMQVNVLRINPLGDSTVLIKDLRYINESGEEISLTTVTLNAQTETVILFEPILTKHLIIQFEQKAHIEKTDVVATDSRVAAINSKLSAKGFTNQLPQKKNKVEGRVYDFSIENLEVGLNVYETKGIFRALPIKVSSPIGVEVQKEVEAIVPTTSLEKDYYKAYSIFPEGATLLESYVGVKLWDKDNNKRVDSLVPVLDTKLKQKEVLAPISEIARFKLFPELGFVDFSVSIKSISSEKKCKEDLEYFSIASSGSIAQLTESAQSETLSSAETGACTEISTMLFTSFENHRLSEGDTFTIVSENPSIAGEVLTVYQVVDETSFYCSSSGGVLLYWTSSSNPFLSINAPVNLDSIKVYQNNSLLTFGKDYSISIDGGSTWRDTFFTASEILEIVKPRANAGKFYIKLAKYDPASYYWAQYLVEKNQYLSTCKQVFLKNGKVVFDKSLKNTSGTLQTVIVSRTTSNNIYLTAVVREYTLGVQARDIQTLPNGKVMKSKLKNRRTGFSNASE
jgi:hypothetical protein